MRLQSFRWLQVGLVLVLVLGLLGGCAEPAAENGADEEPAEEDNGEVSGVLELNGSTTVAPVGQVWAEVFMDENPDVDITVVGTGSGDGVAALINGTTDIAMSSRDIKEEELQEIEETHGEAAQEFVIGQDALAVIVNENNPVEELTLEEIKGIFTGEIVSWADVGGEDREILVYTRDTASGTYAFMQEEVLDDEDYAAESRVTASNAALAETVSQEEAAIGYVGIGFLDQVKAVGVKADEDAEPVLPSMETLETYPIIRPLIFLVVGAPTPVEQAFIDFGMSAEGQELLEETGFLPNP